MPHLGSWIRLVGAPPHEDETCRRCPVQEVCGKCLLGRKRRDHRRLYQERTGDKLNYVAQARELTELRADFDFIRAVHITPLQRMLKS